MKCKHDYETIQQTIKAGMIIADRRRCTKCGVILCSEIKEDSAPHRLEQCRDIGTS